MINTQLGRLVPVLAIALAWALPGTAARAADKVEVQLDWVVRGDHAPFFVARDKGYFAKNGIEVTEIHKGSGSPDTMRIVGNGNAQFGFGDLPTLAVARAQGVPVVAIAALNQRSPLAIISLAKTKMLKTPADLKGLNIGIHPAGSTYIFYKAFLAANGMKESDLKMSTVSPPYESYLLLKRVDVIVGYIDAEVPELEAQAGGPGSLSMLLGADYGYKVYGSGLLTSDKLIHDNPDLVKRFTAAYVKGLKDVAANPEEAAAITAKDVPGYAGKQGVLLAELKADIASTMTSADTKAHGLGWMSQASWQNTLDIMKSQGALPAPVAADTLFTDKFLQ